jgi:hypothetical protein
MVSEDRTSDTTTGARSTRNATPTWTTFGEAIGLFCRGATLRTAAPVAVVVGTVLSLVNQLHVVVEGDATWVTWVRVAVNYAVPYIVASVGFLSACRMPRDP